MHSELVELVGTPPFHVRARREHQGRADFDELREAVLAIAQRGIEYYRFKGLGEMDAA